MGMGHLDSLGAVIVTRAVAGLATHEALSGVTGSISLAAWISLLVPQLIENYKQGSAEGISLTFLLVWFLGDITNLAGAVWAGLVPTVVAIGAYFCFADFVLISQCLYYNYLNRRRGTHQRRRSSTAAGVAVAATIGGPAAAETGTGAGAGAERHEDEVETEDQPLLSRIHSENVGLPGSHTRRRSSAASKRRGGSVGAADGSVFQPERGDGAVWRETMKNVLCVLAVCVVGAAGWAMAWKMGVWEPIPGEEEEGGGEGAGTEMALGAQMLGYVSAVCYLGARIPQIIKNQRDRSCEGLSLLFFLLSLLGNATYGAGILFHSTERQYVLTNLPWLIGSLGTMAEDGIIFVQFHAFKDGGAQSMAVEP